MDQRRVVHDHAPALAVRLIAHEHVQGCHGRALGAVDDVLVDRHPRGIAGDADSFVREDELETL